MKMVTFTKERIKLVFVCDENKMCIFICCLINFRYQKCVSL
jgi:hypothetical protein